jgi:hypothetical protein
MGRRRAGSPEDGDPMEHFRAERRRITALGPTRRDRSVGNCRRYRLQTPLLIRMESRSVRRGNKTRPKQQADVIACEREKLPYSGKICFTPYLKQEVVQVTISGSSMILLLCCRSTHMSEQLFSSTE